MNDLVFLKNKQPVTTSLIIAEGTGNEHESVRSLIRKNKACFEHWGKIRFSVSPNDKGIGRPNKIAYLNEQQAMFLILMLKNSAATIEFKLKLVDEFFAFHTTSTVLTSWIENCGELHQQNKCVYVLGLSNGFSKIGVSQTFARRMNAVVTGSATNVLNWCHTDYLPTRDAYTLESLLKQIFKPWKVNSEFFSIPYNKIRAELQTQIENTFPYKVTVLEGAGCVP